MLVHRRPENAVEFLGANGKKTQSDLSLFQEIVTETVN